MKSISRLLSADELEAACGGFFFAILLKPTELGNATPRFGDDERNGDYDRVQQYKESFNGQRESSTPQGTPDFTGGLSPYTDQDYSSYY